MLKNIYFEQVIIILSALLFYLLLSKVDFLIITIGITCFIVLFSFFDKRFLMLGWIFLAPYFHRIGLESSIGPSIITHNIYVPIIFFIFIFSRSSPEHQIGINIGLTMYSAFIIYLIISAIYLSKGDYLTYRSIYIVYTIPFFIYLILQKIEIDTKFINLLFKICAFHVYEMGIIAINEYMTGDTIFSEELHWTDVGMGRSAGPFSSPIIFGLFVSFLAFYMYYYYKTGKISKLFYTIAFIISSVTVYVTFTRSVWIGYVAGLIFIIAKFSKNNLEKVFKIAGASIILLIVYVLISSQVEVSDRVHADTGTIRLKVADASIDVFFRNPITGVGFGKFNDFLYNKLDYFTTSHVTILTFLVELGLAGTSLILFFLVYSIFKGRGKYKQLTSQDKLLITCNEAFVVSFIINSLLIDMRFFSIAYSMLFLSLGIIQNIYKNNSLKVN